MPPSYPVFLPVVAAVAQIPAVFLLQGWDFPKVVQVLRLEVQLPQVVEPAVVLH